MSFIKLQQVSKYYKSEETVSVGMKRISLDFELGEFVAITGESGSGKSTLLNVISGLDGYEDGELYLFGEETSHYTISDWEKYRGAYIGFVFQNYNIIDSFTVYQNVLLALEVQGYDPKLRKQRALELIEKVGLTSHKNHKASKLSGGQKQRTVIARALAKDCPVIVADEPTGNLDSESGKQVMKLLHEISKDKLIIVVTHDYEQVQEYSTRKIKMHDGEVVEDKKLVKVEPLHLDEIPKTKQLPIQTLLRFSLRNLLSTPKKLIFMLLLEIIVIGAFTIVYTDRVSAIRETGLQQSYVYPNVPETRVLVEKRDGTAFTEDELDDLESSRFVNKVHENGVLFYNDVRLILTEEQDYYYTSYNVNGTDTHRAIDTQDIDGERPDEINEIIFGVSWGEVAIGDTVLLRSQENYNTVLDTFVIVGIDTLERGIIYFSDEYLNQELDDTGQIDYAIYNQIYNQIAGSMSFEYTINAETDAYYVYSSYDAFQTVDLKIEGWGTNFTIVDNQTITVTYESEYTGVAQYVFQNITVGYYDEFYPGAQLKQSLYNAMMTSIMDNLSDVYTLENKHIVSLAVDGYYAGNKVIDTIDSDLYKVYYPANISSPMREFMVFFQGLLAVVYLTLFGLFLYSIVHAVSKNVMNARKKDFAIFRSIGTNRSTLARVVVIEQVMLSSFGFVVTLILMNALGIYVRFLKTTLQYMELQDYFLLLGIFMLFGAWLGLRFNKRVFKQSVIETISQSKGE